MAGIKKSPRRDIGLAAAHQAGFEPLRNTLLAGSQAAGERGKNRIRIDERHLISAICAALSFTTGSGNGTK